MTVPDSSPEVVVSFRTRECDADVVTCLGLELGKSEEDVYADALGLYRAIAKIIAEHPGGMLAYIVDDGYYEVETGIPGEAGEEDD